MPDQDTQTKVFPFKNRGMVVKLDPALLTDGQLQASQNIVSVKEGNLAVRNGRKKLGTMPGGAVAPYKLAKLRLPNFTVPISNATNANPIQITTEVPHGWQTGFMVSITGVNGNPPANGQFTITVIDALNFTVPQFFSGGAYVNGGTATLISGDPSIRYVGDGIDIWRTLDFYSTFTKVSPASGVMGGAEQFANRWSMAPYSAGTTGNPFAYFACPGGMFKDQGNAPFTTLETWGITPALGAATASNAAGSPVAISGASASGLLIEITAVAHGFSTGQTITITQVTGTVEANGTWVITVIDADHFTLNNSVFTNAYISGGQAIVAGPDSTQPGASQYDYAYTFRDPSTGNEGNPSAFMDPSLAVSSQDGAITVTVWGSPDPKITGTNSIALYRRGGSYADGIFRLVAFLTNPGVNGSGVPQPATFVDTIPDIGLLFAAQAEFDNFPPVVSTLRFPVNSTISSGSPGLSPGWNILTLSSPINQILSVGSSLIIGSNSSGVNNNQETCVIAAIPSPSTGSNSTCLVYFQLKHSAGEPVQIGSVVGQACNLALSAFDAMFVAGDPNNPQTLYQSKTGRPEAFPIIDSLGNSHSINVGTPSNGIQNICEFRGKILCLNVSNLYEVDVFQGVMYGPTETPAQRGLAGRWAFVKTDNEVYYLATDGIYLWNGGQSRKISEAIDPLFHGFGAFNGCGPIDLTPNGLKFARMEYYRNQLYFIYMDTIGGIEFLRYDILYDRWTQEKYLGGTAPFIFYEFMLEDDLNAFIFARADAAGAVISQNDLFGTFGTSDEYTASSGINGAAIPYLLQTAFYVPEEFERVKLFLDFILEYTSPRLDPFTVNVYYDYKTSADFIDNFTVIPTTTARTRVTFPLQISGSPAVSAGKEAFSVSAYISGTSTSPSMAFNAIGFRYIDRDAIQQGITSDWMNLGTNNDKRLFQLHLEHNTGGIDVTLVLDIRYGINGTSQAASVAEWVINSTEKTTVTLPIPEAGFPNNLTICKSVRLRPLYTPNNVFRIFYKPTFDKEDLPPDTVLFTEWMDDGYPLNKYAQELMIEVDTNNQIVPVQIQADGNLMQTVTVQTTNVDRHRNITLGPDLMGRQWRLFVDPNAIPAGGKFQLYRNSFQFQKADPGPVNHSFDYDDLGWPYDKALQTVTFEFDTTIGGSFTVNMDTLTGIDGNTLTSPAQTFPLPNSGRGKKTFAINVSTIVKMVRMYPQSDNVGSKIWGYKFKQENYPPDIVTFTEPQDFSYPCEKIARNLLIEIDTGNVPAAITVQADGVNVQTFSITTNYTNRRVVLPFNSGPVEPIGRLWRLLNAPGPGGKAQLFNWSLDFIKEPCQVNFWDSYEQAFGFDGYKLIKQIWLEYFCLSPVVFTLIADNGNVLFSVQLPAHPNRDVERFYVPESNAPLLGFVSTAGTAVTWISGQQFTAPAPAGQQILIGGAVYPVGSAMDATDIALSTDAGFQDMAAYGYLDIGTVYALNKSRVYRMSLKSTVDADGFKFYGDSSRFEWCPLGAEQRSGFSQMRFSELMKIPL